MSFEFEFEFETISPEAFEFEFESIFLAVFLSAPQAKFFGNWGSKNTKTEFF